MDNYENAGYDTNDLLTAVYRIEHQIMAATRCYSRTSNDPVYKIMAPQCVQKAEELLDALLSKTKMGEAAARYIFSDEYLDKYMERISRPGTVLRRGDLVTWTLMLMTGLLKYQIKSGGQKVVDALQKTIPLCDDSLIDRRKEMDDDGMEDDSIPLQNWQATLTCR